MRRDTPPPGTFALHSHAIPALPAGRYTVHAQQSVTAPGAVPETLDAHLEVTAPRFALPADQVLSTFPPNQAQGAFSSRLPQIVLKRRTLPWERELDGDPAVPSRLPRNVPWLALVVLADAEAELRTARPIAECVTPGVVLGGASDTTVGDCIVTTSDVVRQVFPTKEELPLLAHVRHVDLSDTELALGDDDGWLAVVLSNRLPQPGVRYRACLISLEGQYAVLPDELPTLEAFDGVFVYPDAARSYDALSFSYAQFVDRSAKTITSAAAAQVAAARSMTTKDAWSTITGSGIALSSTTAAGPAATTASLIGAMHTVGMEVIAPAARQLTFPVLAHWQFTCTGAGDFQTLMQQLDVGMLGTPPRPPDPPGPGDKPPPPPASAPVEVLDTGHLALRHTSREGQTGTVWYRGPLTPRPTSREQPDSHGVLALAHASDQVRRVGPDGRENLSLATAFDIGRLLALAEPSIVAALLTWRKDALERARHAVLLANEFTLNASGSGLTAGLAALAGRDLLVALGSRDAARLGILRPLTDPGRPIKGIDGADHLELLSTGLGVPVDVVKTLVVPQPGTRIPVPITIADQLADLDKLATIAPRELGTLTRIASSTAAELAAQALKLGPTSGGRALRPQAAATASEPSDALDVLLHRLSGGPANPENPDSIGGP